MTLLVIGAGDLGRAIIQELFSKDASIRILASSRNPARLDSFLNLIRLTAAARGIDVALDGIELNLDDAEKSAQTIDSVHPDLILMAGTRQTWWLPHVLPSRVRQALAAAGYGPWLPIHLDLTQRLMGILRDCQFSGPVITSSYPDVINCVLARQGLAPYCGIGNIAEMVAQIRLRAASYFETPLESIQVRMVGHHALQVATASSAEAPLPPHHLEIELKQVGPIEPKLAEGFLRQAYSIPSGPATHTLTAACAGQVVRAIKSGSSEVIHVPGPMGLPGGYPVRIENGRISVQTFAGLSLTEMVEANQNSESFDGIESIGEDGTVAFREESVEIMDDVLGYRCSRLSPQDVPARAAQLIDRFSQLARDHGINLSRITELQVD